MPVTSRSSLLFDSQSVGNSVPMGRIGPEPMKLRRQSGLLACQAPLVLASFSGVRRLRHESD